MAKTKAKSKKPSPQRTPKAPKLKPQSPTPIVFKPNAAAVLKLVREWMKDESGYDEEMWPKLKAALNRERELVGARKLFED